MVIDPLFFEPQARRRIPRWPIVMVIVLVVVGLTVLLLWPVKVPYFAMSPGPVEEVSDHTHTYRTGRGRGHNNAEAETSPAEEPSDDPNPPMTPLGAGFRVRPLSR